MTFTWTFKQDFFYAAVTDSDVAESGPSASNYTQSLVRDFFKSANLLREKNI